MAKKAPVHGPPVLDEERRKFKDIKTQSEEYRPNCTTGYQAAGVFQHAHHVIPCVSVAKSLAEYFPQKPVEYRRAVYYFTDWDINAGYNLLGLPTEFAYKVAFESMPNHGVNSGRPIWYIEINRLLDLWKALPWRSKRTPKYPIHDGRFGHAEYNGEVKKKLDKIWMELSCKAVNHDPVSGDDLSGAIQGLSDLYRGKLQRKRDQTKEDWDSGDESRLGQFRMI